MLDKHVTEVRSTFSIQVGKHVTLRAKSTGDEAESLNRGLVLAYPEIYEEFQLLFIVFYSLHNNSPRLFIDILILVLFLSRSIK